ncbi:Transmembrane protein 38A, partial [Operophtera brumata]
MDPEAFLDLANQVIKLKMFPYFDIAHSLLCALAVREDLGAAMKEIYRAKKVYDGVSHAGKLYPNAWVIMIIV